LTSSSLLAERSLMVNIAVLLWFHSW